MYTYKFDFTEIYNFNKEMNYRSNMECIGTEVENLDLGDGFYAKVMVIESRYMIWLSHTNCEKLVYAFSIAFNPYYHTWNTEMANAIKLKFKTNYARMKEAYTKKYGLN